MKSFALLFISLFLVAKLPAEERALKTKNVFLITVDGLRWQEIYRGADASLARRESLGKTSYEDFAARYLRESASERREILFPFLWSEIARSGQLIGNRDKGSMAQVTNGKNFSYPGYNELLSGASDPRINSNDKVPNPNVTVLEWLHSKPDFKGKVAAFCGWDAFPYIINESRAGFPVKAGWDMLDKNPAAQNQTLREVPRLWDNVIYDAIIVHEALDYIHKNHPRVVYLAFGETDDWAHEGRYDQYIASAHRFDQQVRRIWETIQQIPEYRDSTTFIITTDHGRGITTETWKSHGASISESAYIWMAVMGPDTPPLGERSGITSINQNQIAATLAFLLGNDFLKAFPKAGSVIQEVLPLK